MSSEQAAYLPWGSQVAMTKAIKDLHNRYEPGQRGIYLKHLQPGVNGGGSGVFIIEGQSTPGRWHLDFWKPAPKEES